MWSIDYTRLRHDYDYANWCGQVFWVSSQPFQYRFLWFNQTNKKGPTQNAQRSQFFGKEVRAQTAVFRPYSRPIKATIFTAQLSYQIRHQGLQTLFPVKDTSKQPELDSFETYILLLSTRLLASCAKHHLAILSCYICTRAGSPVTIEKNFGNPHKNVVLCSCRCSDKSGSLSMAPLYEKAEGNFQFGPLIKQRKFPDSTHEEGGNTTKAGAGNFCHSNSRIKHISGQWIFCYASAYAIQLLYDKFAEKNHDFLDSCWHVVFRKKTLWDFLLKRCWQQQHLFYTLTPSTWAFPSFYRPTAYQVLTEDVTPAPGISQLIVRTQLIFRPLLGP